MKGTDINILEATDFIDREGGSLKANSRIFSDELLVKLDRLHKSFGELDPSSAPQRKRIQLLLLRLEKSIKAIKSLEVDEHELHIFNAFLNLIWLKAAQSETSYLDFVSLSDGNDDSLLSRFKQTILKYCEIRVPNQLIAVQPKLQLINSIEA